MKRMIGSIDSGIVLDGKKGASVILREWLGGMKGGEITVNHFEIQELINALEEFK